MVWASKRKGLYEYPYNSVDKGRRKRHRMLYRRLEMYRKNLETEMD